MAKKSYNTGEMSFLEHLEELRWHIVRAVASVLIFAIVAFIFSKFLFDYVLLAPKNPDFITNRLLYELSLKLGVPELAINRTGLELQNIEIGGQFTADIMVSIYAGLIVSFPYIIWEIWRFIKPALYENERKHATGSVLAITVMFFIGALFGYFIIVPLTIHFLGGWQVSTEIVSRINLKSYLSGITFIPFATGIIFELPIFMIFLTKAGIITPQFMIKYRRHAIIVLMLLAALITPPDIFSMILVVMPLLLLYEISIILTKRVLKKMNSK